MTSTWHPIIVNGYDTFVRYTITDFTPTFDIHKFVTAFYSSNRNKIAKATYFDKNIAKVTVTKDHILLNEHAFMQYINRITNNTGCILRKWFLSDYTRTQGRPRTETLPLLPNDTILRLPQNILEILDNGSESEQKTLKKRRKLVLQFMCTCYKLPFTTDAIKTVLTHIFRSTAVKLDSGTFNGNAILSVLVEQSPNIISKIQHDILAKYKSIMLEQNLILFLLTEPTKHVWNTQRMVLFGKQLGNLPIELAPGVRFPEIMYCYDTIRAKINTLIEPMWRCYTPISFTPNPHNLLGYYLKVGGIQVLLDLYFVQCQQYLSTCMTFREKLVQIPLFIGMEITTISVLAQQYVQSDTGYFMLPNIQVYNWLAVSEHVEQKILQWYEKQVFVDQSRSQLRCEYHQFFELSRSRNLYYRLVFIFDRTVMSTEILTTLNYLKVFNRQPVLHLVIGGDGFKKGSFGEENRKYLSHSTLKIANLDLKLFSKISNHFILGVLEGKESYEGLKLLYLNIVTELKQFEENGVVLNNKKYLVQVSFTGDMKWVWLLVGFHTRVFSGKICWHCHFNSDDLGAKWYCSCNIRSMHDLTQEKNQPNTNVVNDPILFQFLTQQVKGDIHHAWTGFIRAFCRIMINTASVLDSEVVTTPTLDHLNQLFKERHITLVLEPNPVSIQIIGKMCNPIFDLINEIGDILHFTNKQIHAVRYLQKVLNILNGVGTGPDGAITDEEKSWCIDNLQDIVQNFIETFEIGYVYNYMLNVDRWFNYVHTLTTLMREDMIEWGTILFFSCASFEGMSGYHYLPISDKPLVKEHNL